MLAMRFCTKRAFKLSPVTVTLTAMRSHEDHECKISDRVYASSKIMLELTGFQWLFVR
ncbi:hypothetical protein Plhal304r1_c004g0017491 [Plasmopara halstedii]